MITQTRTLLLIGSAADGLNDLRARLVQPAQQRGWQVTITVTPTAATWLAATGELSALERATGYPVRHQPRLPTEISPHPAPDCVAVVPASANTVAKLALGIADNQALTSTCEAIGDPTIPVVVIPRTNPAHANHPAWPTHLNTLHQAGVHLLTVSPEPEPGLDPASPGPKPLPWPEILDLIDAAKPTRP